MPIFFSCLPWEKPLSVFSTMKAEISFMERPRLSVVLPVTAMMTKVSATLPLVMKHLEPLRM